MGKSPFSGIDFKRDSTIFATSGSVVTIWDINSSSPVGQYSWGNDSLTTVKFNPVQTEILASCATDRSVILYDLQSNTPIKKIIMKMKTNAVSWNPMEAFIFTMASEDQNLHTFDLRYLDRALRIHEGHVSAVLDVDYSPTGKEFCSGSWDKSIRIFEYESTKSREVYHTKRMQRLFTVKFTPDARFVLTGSDDTNIRLWKANASEPLGPQLPRQKQAIEYRQKLKQRFKHIPELARIVRHRQLPRTIYSMKRQREIMKQSDRKKQEKRAKHSKHPEKIFKDTKSKQIVTTVE